MAKVKSDVKSMELREKGNRYLQNGNLDDALLTYNEVKCKIRIENSSCLNFLGTLLC